MTFQVTPVNFLNDQDTNRPLESGIVLPFANDPIGSYLYYDCIIGVALDSGIVVHNRLPQVDRTPDTLGAISYDDPNLNQEISNGVSLKCLDQYTDIMQRMGHSRYWFRMWGQAIRVGYKVPIPRLITIAGVTAIPYDKNPQWAYNRIIPGSNFGGVFLWHGVWSQWYTTSTPPINNTIPVADPSALVTATNFPLGNPELPNGIQVPLSTSDDNATQPPPAPGFFVGG